MPLLNASDYRPQLLLRSAHMNTIYPYLFRNKVHPDYDRVRFQTKDQDFIDLDTLISGEKTLVIQAHGLEGSSESQYIRYMSKLLRKNKMDVVTMNHRSCSGEMNRKLQMYHSGFTDDLHEVVEAYEAAYDKIILIGYSLGGNVILKYMNDGVYPVSDKIKVVVAISTPVDLSSSGEKIATKENIIYERNFLRSLMQKMKEKSSDFPEEITEERMKKVSSLEDFDEIFTGPLNGFTGAQDYYTRCSSKPFLHKTDRPTLLINAVDDPFLARPSYPYDIARKHENLFFLAPKFGGHVGFATFGDFYYWHELKTLDFIHENI